MATVDIRRNDTVKVIAGRDKGKEGRVLRVNPGTSKVLVEHVSMVKKNVRPNPQKQIKGGIADKPMPMDVSNVMMLTAGGIPTRVGYKLENVGGKVRRTRIARKGGESLEKK